MSRTISLVQSVTIASPCTASWDAMTGNDQMRFCHQCKLNVYNLSAMTAEEGERLIREKEGRICARIYKRADGTILTQDCPVGLEKLRRRARRIVAKVAAVVFFLVGGFAFARSEMSRSSRFSGLSQIEPIASINRWLNPSPPTTQWIMGDMMVPPPPTANVPASNLPVPSDGT